MNRPQESETSLLSLLTPEPLLLGLASPTEVA